MNVATTHAVFPGWHQTTGAWIRAHAWEAAVTSSMAWVDQFAFLRCYRARHGAECAVMVEWHPGEGWHLSISLPTRYPVWDEIKQARYELLPDAITMAMLLPPRGEYVNLHPNTFHLHEVAGTTPGVSRETIGQGVIA